MKSLTKAQLASELAVAKARISELETQLAALNHLCLSDQRDVLRGNTPIPSTPRSEEFPDRRAALAELKRLCLSGQRAVLRGNTLILL